MARKTAKSIYKNLLLRDLIIIHIKKDVLRELVEKVEAKKSGWWFF